MSGNIPFDIQMEIIKKVADVKSLIQFRSVSKPWKSFIDSPEFIACFGVRHTQPQSLLFRYKDNNVDEVRYVSFVDGVTFPQQQDFAPNVSDLVKQLKDSTVIGSSCGLWCLQGFNSSGTEEMAVMWNPSISKSVGIVLPPVHNSSPSDAKVTTQLLVLGSKTWKMIPSSNMPRESIRVTPSTQVATNRFIFWVAGDTIATNDGSLVVSTYTDEDNGLVYGVWMMGEEGGVMTSFTKLFNINTPYDSSVGKVLGFTMSGEPITETEKNFGEFAKVEVYKPCSEHITDLRINGEHGSIFICPYTETLLLLDHSDCCIISNDS
ncbi:F-box protein-like protein [Tanacetum coccineum]